MDCEDHVVPPVKCLDRYDSNQSAASLTLDENDAVHVQLTSGTSSSNREEERPPEPIGLSHFVIITSSAKTARRPNWCSKTAPSIFLSIVVLGTEVTLASSIDSERSVSRGMPQHCCVPLCSSRKTTTCALHCGRLASSALNVSRMMTSLFPSTQDFRRTSCSSRASTFLSGQLR